MARFVSLEKGNKSKNNLRNRKAVKDETKNYLTALINKSGNLEINGSLADR